MCLHVYVVFIWFWFFGGSSLAEQLLVLARNHKVASNWCHQQKHKTKNTYLSVHFRLEKMCLRDGKEVWGKNFLYCDTLWQKNVILKCCNSDCVQILFCLVRMERLPFFLNLNLLSWLKTTTNQIKVKPLRHIQIENDVEISRSIYNGFK